MKRAVSIVLLVAVLASCATMGRMWRVIDTSKLNIGMTRQEVDAVTPLPQRVHRTVTQGIVYEQLVYINSFTMATVYLYMENGVLVGWQD